ncbi:MAG TPA: hypothetical protein VGF18_06305, partial [Candidatus Tumulicola sp.]
MIRRSMLLAAALVATVSLPALAAGLDGASKTFVDRAFSLNTTALARAHIAASSADNYVLDYTEALIGDRNAANDQLQAIAQTANYHSPNAPRSEM